MNRKISTAIVALALGFGAPAFAQDATLDPSVTETLTQYGYDVDPSLFTEAQIERFGVMTSGDNAAADEPTMRRQIDQILVMDAGTSTFVSEEMRAMMDNPTELEANAADILNRVGMTDFDVSTLTTEQLAQLWFLSDDNSSEDGNDIQLRVQEILGSS